MLIELAIGDAYGAGFEYADPTPPARPNDLSGYVRHPRHSLPPGSYTDDTQMSLAVAEAVVDDARWTADELAHRFVSTFQRDPRDGYARSFQAFLESVTDGRDFLERIRPDSDKSGAAMRAGPIGVYPSVSKVLHRAKVQAAITHDTPDGIAAAQAAALATHYFLYTVGPKADLGRFLEDNVAGQWNIPWIGKVGQQGWMSVRAAVTAVMACDRMTGLLRTCVDYRGDVDTVAAIALAAAAASPEVEQDLPEHLLRSLENGPYGRGHIEGADRRLLALVRQPTP